MGSKFEKWMKRAEEFERVLANDGLEAAEQYLLRFDEKIDKLMEALFELQFEKEEDAYEEQMEALRFRAALAREAVLVKKLGLRPSFLPSEDSEKPSPFRRKVEVEVEDESDNAEDDY